MSQDDGVSISEGLLELASALAAAGLFFILLGLLGAIGRGLVLLLLYFTNTP